MKPEVTANRIMSFRAATGLTVTAAKKFITDQPQSLIDRILAAAQASGRIPDLDLLADSSEDLRDRLFSAANLSGDSSRLIDPIERDPVYGDIVRRVMDEVAREMHEEGVGDELGSCHMLWRRCKSRLKSVHNIDWYSPAELNPGTCFD